MILFNLLFEAKFELVNKVLLVCLIILSFSCKQINTSVNTQNPFADSVQSLIKKADSLSKYDLTQSEQIFKNLIADSNKMNDTLYYNILRGMGDLFLYNVNPEKALYYYKNAKRIAKQSQDSVRLANVLNDLGLTAHYRGKLDSAIYYYTKAYRISLMFGRTASYSRILLNLSNTYASKGETGAAFKLLVEVSKIAYDNKDSVSLRITYNNMARLVAARGDNRSAISYTLKALKYDSASLIDHHMLMLNMGIYYYDLKMIDSSLYYNAKSKEYYEKLNDSLGIIQLMHNNALVKSYKGEKEQAAKEFSYVLDYSKRNNSSIGIAMSSVNLAEVKIELGQYEEALSVLNYAEPHIKQFAYSEVYQPFLKLKSSALEQLGKVDQSLALYKRYMHVQDSMKLIAKDDLLNEEKTRLESLVKEKEILLALHKLRSEKKARTIQSYSIVGLTGILLTLLVLFVILRKQLKSKNYAYKALQSLYSQSAVVDSTLNEEYIDEDTLVSKQTKQSVSFNPFIPLVSKRNIQAKTQRDDSSLIEYNDYHKILIETDMRLKEVETLLNEEKLFLDPALDLSSVATLVKMPENELINLIKEIHDLSFDQYINTFRISYAIDLLNDSANNALPVEEIGAKSGFSSKSIFVSLFKQYTGLPPVLYRMAVQGKTM